MTEQTLDQDQYLEQSARTVSDVEISRELFDNEDAKLLHQAVDIIQSGHTADVMKRSLFYHDKKIAERLEAATANMAKMYEHLESEEGKKIRLRDEDIDFLHAILGIASEAGELMEELINSYIEGRPVDKENGIEEAGDIMWYQALLIRYLNTNFGYVGFKNIEKLKVRYPENFTSEDALNRDLKAEKVAVGE